MNQGKTGESYNIDSDESEWKNIELVNCLFEIMGKETGKGPDIARISSPMLRIVLDTTGVMQLTVLRQDKGRTGL